METKKSSREKFLITYQKKEREREKERKQVTISLLLTNRQTRRKRFDDPPLETKFSEAKIFVYIPRRGGKKRLLRQPSQKRHGCHGSSEPEIGRSEVAFGR